MEKCAPLRSWLRNYLVQTTRSGSARCYSNDSKVTSSQANQTGQADQSGQDNSSNFSNTSPRSTPSDAASSSDSLPPYPDPNLCCRDGCQNCVWIEYAKELGKHHKDSALVIREIEKQIEDPSIRAFIIMQVRESLDKKD